MTTTHQFSAASNSLQEQILAVRHEIEQQHWNVAIDILSSLLQSHPNEGEIHYLIAFCLHQSNRDPIRCLGHYTLALTHGHDPFWVHYQRGVFYNQHHLRTEALIDWHAAYHLTSNHSELNTLLATFDPEYRAQPLLARGWRKFFIRLKNTLSKRIRKLFSASYMNGRQHFQQRQAFALNSDSASVDTRLLLATDIAHQTTHKIQKKLILLNARIDALEQAVQTVPKLEFFQALEAQITERIQQSTRQCTEHTSAIQHTQTTKLLQALDWLMDRIDQGHRDTLVSLRRRLDFVPANSFVLETNHPIAIESDDHLFPRGAANDNTRYARFVKRCEDYFGHPLTTLDLGCSGGGIVLEFLLRGHHAFGLEGCDLPKKSLRAEWRLIPESLETCDITRPFILRDQITQTTAQFDVISAWEVLEHIPEKSLPQLIENIKRHLHPHGLFVASVALFEDRDPITGAIWHVTLKPPEWWNALFESHGFELVHGQFVSTDFPRGSGNGKFDWSVITDPSLGFHIVAKRNLKVDPMG